MSIFSLVRRQRAKVRARQHQYDTSLSSADHGGQFKEAPFAWFVLCLFFKIQNIQKKNFELYS